MDRFLRKVRALVGAIAAKTHFLQLCSEHDTLKLIALVKDLRFAVPRNLTLGQLMVTQATNNNFGLLY